MEKPLTDKVYDDGSKFDDSRGMSIDLIGKLFVLKAYVKERYFQVTFKNKPPINKCGLSNEAVSLLASTWAVGISYCPICGRKLGDTDG